MNNTNVPQPREQGITRGWWCLLPNGGGDPLLEVVVVVVLVAVAADDDDDDDVAPEADGSVWVRTLTTSRGVTIRDVIMEPIEPETILAVNAVLLQLFLQLSLEHPSFVDCSSMAWSCLFSVSG